MVKQDLHKLYYTFGNKGDVWGNNVHIAVSGNPRTLCGKPMLSSNYGSNKEIGCPDCIKTYNEIQDSISEIESQLSNK